jgi:glycosyltransferase involved in cell wall biosynthesis
VTVVFLLQDTGRLYGAERATLDLAQGLARRDVRVHLLLIEEARLRIDRNDLREEARARGIDFTALPVKGRWSPELARRIRREVESRRAILHTTGYKADVHGGWAASWGRRFPVVGTVHGWLFRQDLKERFFGWVNLMALRRFTRVIVLSRFYEDLLLRRGVARERLVRIPSGLAIGECGPACPAGVFTVGMLGRLSEEKNHALLLRAAALLRAQGVVARFLIAGDGPLRQELEAMAREKGLGDDVEFAGFLSRESFFGRIHALALCSRIENLPLSVLEAMAFGRPVVATAVGGLPDLVEDGRTGFLVPSEDAEALARRIRELTASPDLCRSIAEAARRKLESEFSSDEMVARHLALYASAI